MLSDGNLIDEIYGNTININNQEFYESIVLAPKNSDVLEMNEKRLLKIRFHHCLKRQLIGVSKATGTTLLNSKGGCSLRS